MAARKAFFKLNLFYLRKKVFEHDNAVEKRYIV